MPIHSIEPVFDEKSKVLILGSFPSAKSREVNFFYGHKQNRFWRVLSNVLGEIEPFTTAEKKAFLLKKRIALWDVIGECDIEGSSDSTIRNVKENDLSTILDTAEIRRIYVNGKCAEKYYKRYILPKIKIDCVSLPSTSPANAAFSFDRLCSEWSTVAKELEESSKTCK